jgi:hypothetical protein
LIKIVIWLFLNKQQAEVDIPPNSLKDSNANFKAETLKEEKVEVCSFAHKTLGYEKGMLKLQDGD